MDLLRIAARVASPPSGVTGVGGGEMEESTVVLESCAYVPMQEDEEPGMPAFRVKGVISLKGRELPFEGEIAVETDGRDIEWDGTPDTPEFADWETNALGDIVDAVWKTPAWKEAEAAHGL